MATLQTVRRWIMTAAVASITITGTIYGAGLKGQQEVKQVCSAILHISRLSVLQPYSFMRTLSIPSLQSFNYLASPTNPTTCRKHDT